MAHISSIGAGMFSDLAVAMPAAEMSQAALAALDTGTEFQALFANEIPSVSGTKGVGTFVRIKNAREFPSMGTPPNITNVPVYGAKTSQQIQAQADAPSMEITLNYVPAEWAAEAGNLLGSAVGDGKQYVFRFTLMNAEPTGTGDTKYASVANGVGTVGNSQYYWVGKIEALQINPQLSDANTATLTLTMQSQFFGAYTI
jgi:hypothetical protein